MKVQGLDGRDWFYMTTIYAHNQLELRSICWTKIERLQVGSTSDWLLLGDFNNVLSINDRIGGNAVHMNEFVDLENMMTNLGLFEMPSSGNHFTWSNKHSQGMIYSGLIEWWVMWNGLQYG